eukprot:2876977-Amphidinium_carterae.2
MCGNCRSKIAIPTQNQAGVFVLATCGMRGDRDAQQYVGKSKTGNARGGGAMTTCTLKPGSGLDVRNIKFNS